MKARMTQAHAAVLVGLCSAFVSGAAFAESNTAVHHAALRKACTAQDGRFEQSWAYNDQGVQWGKVVSCVTSAGYVRCQDNTCRSGRWALRGSSTASKTGSTKNDGVARFAAEPAAFSAALAALSGK